MTKQTLCCINIFPTYYSTKLTILLKIWLLYHLYDIQCKSGSPHHMGKMSIIIIFETFQCYSLLLAHRLKNHISKVLSSLPVYARYNVFFYKKAPGVEVFLQICCCFLFSYASFSASFWIFIFENVCSFIIPCFIWSSILSLFIYFRFPQMLHFSITIHSCYVLQPPYLSLFNFFRHWFLLKPLELSYSVCSFNSWQLLTALR